MKMAQMVTGEQRKELDMVFSFDHLETPGHIRMEDYKYDLNYYRDYMIDWMENYGDNCWMSIFYNNHDNPRMISKITNKKEHHQQLAILLAVMQMTLKGTPFVFQGDEMGLSNVDFTSMDQITDVEAKGYYEEHIQTKSHEEVFNLLLAGTREHTRILLPWNKKLPAWHEGIQQNINENVFNAYKQLIQLRQSDKTLIYGDFKVINRKKDHFTYQRGNDYLIDCNLSETSLKAYVPSSEWKLIYPKMVDKNTMKPYEARIYKKS